MKKKGEFLTKRLEKLRRQKTFDLFKKLRDAKEKGLTVYFNAKDPYGVMRRWKTTTLVSEHSVVLYGREIFVVSEYFESDGKYNFLCRDPILLSRTEDFGFCLPVALLEKKKEKK